jgi:hypothetical protein
MQLNHSSDIEEGVKLKKFIRQVNIVDKLSQTSKTVIILKGDIIDSSLNLQIFALILKEYRGATIEITDIPEGTIEY